MLREKLDETNVRLTSLSQDVDGLREIIPQSAPVTMMPAARIVRGPKGSSNSAQPRITATTGLTYA